ncbi:tetratricopeptide repeat-containing sensor histidine kinase [Chitinophaga ginsengisoli]|uniref:Histidine kinase/DNA gyrase B/HSP90-like ATPase n=1 Tax=Chitinophaga ginsengisoli TaxID=363837 RepID=A0A2P8G701_9BACT|nr:sensor histidine kinase [Chitinophaga ginsengisoli]PSL29742.1 histidine kinase/DNA gyrase B/HSP90-like ATPase [Chitinophaga ginsengisoli]
MGNLSNNSHGTIRRALLFLLVLLSGNCLSLTAQTVEDRLPRTVTQPRTSKKNVDSLLKLAGSKRDTAAGTAMRLYYTGMEDARMLRYNNGVARALSGLALCYNNNNEKDKALSCERMALHYCENNEQGIAVRVDLYILLSQTFYYRGKYDSSAFYRYAALDVLEANQVKDRRMQTRVYCSLLDFWLNINENISNDMHIQQVMGHINTLIDSARIKKDTAALMMLYFYKAGYFNNIVQNDSARYYCSSSIQMGKATRISPSMEAGLLINTALTYLDDKNPAPAIHYLEKAKALFPQLDPVTNRHQIFADILLGQAYLMQQQYNKAITITTPAMQSAHKRNMVHLLTARGNQVMADAYEALGQYKKAAEYRKTYSVIRDSMMKVEKLELVYNLEMRYRIADKNKELAEKQLAITRNESRIKTKNFLIIGVSAGLLLILLVSILIYRNNLNKQKLQAEKIRNLRQELQISNLQAMIAGEEKERSRIARDLHDGMGGTLGAIRTRLSSIFRRHTTADVTDDFREVLHLLEEASTELRKTAHNLMPEILLQEGLAKATALFCERVRKGHTLEITFQVIGNASNLSSGAELTVYRIIQELVHNILKHANARHAIVQIAYYETQLAVTVEDDGNGMLTTSQSDGIGLKTIRERVNSLNGELHIDSVPGQGTSVHIEITLKQNTASYAYKISDC